DHFQRAAQQIALVVGDAFEVEREAFIERGRPGAQSIVVARIEARGEQVRRNLAALLAGEVVAHHLAQRVEDFLLLHAALEDRLYSPLHGAPHRRLKETEDPHLGPHSTRVLCSRLTRSARSVRLARRYPAGLTPSAASAWRVCRACSQSACICAIRASTLSKRSSARR